MLHLPQDDLLAITRAFLNPDVSRSGLPPCPRRHGASNLNALKPKEIETLSKEFTDRLFSARHREPTGKHEFDQLCHELQIDYRLTKPRSPQPTVIVESFNGRIADKLKTNRFVSGKDLEQPIMRYVTLYNTQFPQPALGSRNPIQAMMDWHRSNPNLFVRKSGNRPKCDQYVASYTTSLIYLIHQS
jgi:hypothetical protein